MPVPLTTTQRRAALQAIMERDEPYITPAAAAPVMGCTAYLINLTVDEDIESYGEIRSYPFHVERRGRRVLISRREFIKYYAVELGMEQPPPELSEAYIEAIAQRTAELLYQKINGGVSA